MPKGKGKEKGEGTEKGLQQHIDSKCDKEAHMQYSTEIRKRIDEALRSLIGIAERVDGYDDWKRIPPIPKLELTREGDWDLPEKEQNTAKNIRRFTGLRFVGKTRADYDRYRDVLKPIAYDSQKEYNARKRATPATKEKEMEKRHLNGNEIAIDRDKLERAAHSNGYKSLAELCRAAFVEKRKEGVMVSDNYLTERLRKNGTIPEEGVNVLCEHLSVPRNAISQTSDPVQTSLDLDRANTEQEGEFRFNARMSVEMGEYLKQKAWLLHKSMTDTLFDIVANDMAQHPEVMESKGADMADVLRISRTLSTSSKADEDTATTDVQEERQASRYIVGLKNPIKYIDCGCEDNVTLIGVLTTASKKDLASLLMYQWNVFMREARKMPLDDLLALWRDEQ